MISNALEKPCIFVCVSSPEESLLKEILAGIEEEGIPYDVKKLNFEEGSILKQTYYASQQSRIGIAIGVINNRIVLQYNKLKEEHPLIDVKLKFYEKEKGRNIGCNAARLYKVMPLKELESVDDQLVEKIRSAVTLALSQMK